MTHVIGHHDMTHLSTSTRHLVMSAQLGVPVPQSTLGMTSSDQLKKLRFGKELRKSCKCCNEANNVKMVACHCGFLNSALLPQFQWGSLHKDYVGPSYLYSKFVFEYIWEKFQNYFESPHPSCLETGLFKKQSSV